MVYGVIPGGTVGARDKPLLFVVLPGLVVGCVVADARGGLGVVVITGVTEPKGRGVGVVVPDGPLVGVGDTVIDEAPVGVGDIILGVAVGGGGVAGIGVGGKTN